MGWLHRNLPWLLIALFVATTVMLVGAFAVGMLVVFGALLSGASMSAALGGTAAVLSVVALLVTANVLLAFSILVTTFRRISVPRSDRLATVFALVEQLLPPARGLALSERFGPSPEERKREIKRRYVEGKLTEAEFEQQMQLLLDQTDLAASELDETDDLWERELATDVGDRVRVERDRDLERE